MKIEKTFTVEVPLAKAWAFITAPASVAPCIPGCEGAEQVDDTHYKARVALAIGPIKTAFNVDIEQVEARAPEFAQYQIKGDEGSQASRVKSLSTLSLKALSDSQTEVHYVSDVTIVGRLGKFGSGMVQKKADAIGDEFVAALRARLAAPEEVRPVPEVALTDALQAGPAVIDPPEGSAPRWLLWGLVAVAVTYGLIAWLGSR
jgi:uncharacterized protein